MGSVNPPPLITEIYPSVSLGYRHPYILKFFLIDLDTVLIHIIFIINIIEGDRNCVKDALKTTPHISLGGYLDDLLAQRVTLILPSSQ